MGPEIPYPHEYVQVNPPHALPGPREWIRITIDYLGEERRGWYRDGCWWFFSGVTVVGVMIDGGVVEKEVLEEGEVEEEFECWFCYWGEWLDRWPNGRGSDWCWDVCRVWSVIPEYD